MYFVSLVSTLEFGRQCERSSVALGKARKPGEVLSEYDGHSDGTRRVGVSVTLVVALARQ